MHVKRPVELHEPLGLVSVAAHVHLFHHPSPYVSIRQHTWHALVKVTDAIGLAKAVAACCVQRVKDGATMTVTSSYGDRYVHIHGRPEGFRPSWCVDIDDRY